MILVRCTTPDPEIRRWAQALSAASSLPAVFVVDERRGPVDLPPDLKIGLTQLLVEALGLYAPADFAWRCGDYGFYAARQRFPNVARFWLIEHDVRIARDRDFFDALTAADDDLLAARLESADDNWYWSAFTRARDVRPWRCLFPVVRVSAPLVDHLYRVRRAHSRQFDRRLVWPNDESFTATTAVAGGFRCADFNARLPDAWRADEFTYDTPIRARDFDPARFAGHLVHPVLSEEAYARKLVSLKSTQGGRLHRRAVRKALRGYQTRRAWLHAGS